jgi:asparagine synthase (glutamine-hydrolysing)
VRDGWSKRIVRQAAAGLLPDDVRWRRGRWVHLGWKFVEATTARSNAFFEHELAGDMSCLAPYADVSKLRKLYRNYLGGDVDAGWTIWTAAVLSSWLRKTASRRYDSRARTAR